MCVPSPRGRVPPRGFPARPYLTDPWWETNHDTLGEKWRNGGWEDKYYCDRLPGERPWLRW
jgi:hypothetical protein